MKVELSRNAKRAFLRLNEPLYERVKKAICKLSLEPPEGDIKKLEGCNGYRLRVGGYRILFDFAKSKDEKNKDYEEQIISIEAIEPRGQVYKGKGDGQ